MALVDLPGYGFAYADEDKIANWKALVRHHPHHHCHDHFNVI
jgi:GTP-binding protein EngB required for normal cell division